MESIISFFSGYFSYWPLVCFFALLLAGFNIPISEDVLIVMSALIAYEDRSLLIPNYLALYAGIYASDIVSYWMGRLIGNGMLKINFFKKALNPARVDYLSRKLEKHGFLTFIVTRFIPFGMRNALFMTSGFTMLSFPKFLLFDGIAAIISSLTLYSLVLFIGESAQQSFKVVGIILFVAMWGSIIAFIIRRMIRRNKRKKGLLNATHDVSKEKEVEQLKKAE